MKAKAEKKSREEISDPKTAIYLFKIYLLNISPMIYRRFKVKGDAHLGFIVNYSDSYHYGETITTSFIESTVNYVIAKRFAKKNICNGQRRELTCSFKPERKY